MTAIEITIVLIIVKATIIRTTTIVTMMMMMMVMIVIQFVIWEVMKILDVSKNVSFVIMTAMITRRIARQVMIAILGIRVLLI